MANSTLLGIEHPIPAIPGHDENALGPSDSSDSGSDVAGLDPAGTVDPQMPVDRALAEDVVRPAGLADALESDSDRGGTGERRSAAGDAGGREASDISVDRIFSPLSPDEPDDPEGLVLDDAVASVDQAAAEDELDDEDLQDLDDLEDESADPVGDGHSDAQLAEQLPPVRRRSVRKR